MYATDGYGRDERNFAEYPMSLLMGNSSDETPPTTLTYEDSIPHPVSGIPLKRRFVMKSTGDHGMPTTMDEEILLALFSIHYQKNGFADDFFHVTPNEMVGIMEWKKTGFYYHRFFQSLHRWRDIQLNFYGAWYDVVNQAYTNAFMAVIPNFIVHPTASGTTKSYEITWDRILHQNLKAGYIRVIDLKVYRRLRSPIAKRMYRYLGANPGNAGKTLVFDLMTFAHKQLGISPDSYKKASQLKRTLNNSLQALEQEGFIQPAPTEFRYQKYAGGHRLHIELADHPSTQLTAPRAPDNPSPALPAPSEKTPSASDHPIVHELFRRGVSLIGARDLVKEEPTAYISEWIARTDLMADHEFKKDRASTIVWGVKAKPKNFGVAKKQQRSLPYHAPVLETPEEPNDPIMVYLESLTAADLSNMRKEANLKHPDELDKLKKNLTWLMPSEDKYQKSLDYGVVNLLYGKNLKNPLT